MSKIQCYCGSESPFLECCERFLNQKNKPKIAEQLMRSRFSAFCLTDYQYLINTKHPSKRSVNELVELQQSGEQTIWVQLTILNTHLGLDDHNSGSVTFSALFNEQGQFYELTEQSNFIKERSQWYYLDGKHTVQRTNMKFKRNAPCWCHSGKKIKHCHKT